MILREIAFIYLFLYNILFEVLVCGSINLNATKAKSRRGVYK